MTFTFRLIRTSTACGACLVAISAAFGTPLQSIGAQSPRFEQVGISALRMPLTPAFQSTGAESDAKPALEPARVAGQVLAGAYSSMAGYLVGSWAGSVIGSRMPGMSDVAKERVKFVTGVLGATAATAASVSAIGNIGDQTGSYPAALAGTAAGVTAGIILNQLLYGHARLPSETGSSKARWLEASLEALLPSIGATIAFNSTRRFK
ncbi:MAG: hypothetical protein P3A28_07360 [Gemmatimonadota bacterium]|nr:hypothetical protein [Gemmatimonadota bacterium]